MTTVAGRHPGKTVEGETHWDELPLSVIKFITCYMQSIINISCKCEDAQLCEENKQMKQFLLYRCFFRSKIYPVYGFLVCISLLFKGSYS